MTPRAERRQNALAERVVGTLRRECLDHLIIFNDRHLLRVLAEHVAHYNAARPHRSLALAAPDGLIARAAPPPRGRIGARSVLGGLHHEYDWVAA
jgi:putative transposase